MAECISLRLVYFDFISFLLKKKLKKKNHEAMVRSTVTETDCPMHDEFTRNASVLQIGVPACTTNHEPVIHLGAKSHRSQIYLLVW